MKANVELRQTSMKRMLYILFFLALVPEKESTWGGHWSPLQYVTSLLEWTGLKLPVFDLLVLIILVTSRNRAPNRRIPEMDKAIWVAIGAMLLWCVRGLTQGGDGYQMQFQIFATMSGFLFAFAVAKVLITPEDYYRLGKVFFAAAVYRACTCISFYVATVSSGAPPPDYCTLHEDTVTFVSGIMLAVAYIVERRGRIKSNVALSIAIGVVLLSTCDSVQQSTASLGQPVRITRRNVFYSSPKPS